MLLSPATPQSVGLAKASPWSVGAGSPLKFRHALRPGLLRAPPFQGRPPNISATLAPDRAAGEFSGIEFALAEGTRAQAKLSRAKAAVAAIREARIGGDFWAPPWRPSSAAFEGDLVVLRPQSVSETLSLVNASLAANPALAVLVSIPDTSSARRLEPMLRAKGVDCVCGPFDPWSVLPRIRNLYAAGDDPLALLALFDGRPVHCTQAGDVSGWGLTTDDDGIAQRAVRTMAEIAHTVLVSKTLYVNPFDGREAACEEIIEILGDWRGTIERNREVICCVGMAWWKRRAIADLFATGGRRPAFAKTPRAAVRQAGRQGGAIAVWATRAPKRLATAAAWADVPVWSVEDGFLRSTGLGSQFVPPCSIVVDRQVPHYDPRRPSDLETLLVETEFSPDLLARAEGLIAAIVEGGLSKYNVGGLRPPALPEHRRLVLVPGQVADDESLRLGGGRVQDAADLLRRVRAAEPQAFILYKPHPDVESGLRRGGLAERDALAHADLVVRRTAMPALLSRVDAVHTVSSLSGFEALLRGRDVIVHGQPFYAGWGLTQDLAPISRRQRRLSLTQLVAGALILYPLYRDPVTGLPCPPELLLERFKGAAPHATTGLRLRRLQGWLARALDRGAVI